MLGLAFTLVVVFSVLLWLSVSAVRSVGEAYLLTRLEHDAEALVTGLWVNPAGLLRMREGRVTPIYHQPLSGHYFEIRTADGGGLRSRSLWDERLDAPVVEVGDIQVTRRAGPIGQTLLVRSAGYARDDLVFSLAVAEDLTPMEIQIRRFQGIALGVFGVALVSVVSMQRWVLRRGFKAIELVRDQLRAIARGQRERLDFMGPVEVRPLSAEINRLLGQLQQRLQRSRQALGNLAHGLKSPLTLVTSELERSALPASDKARIAARLERIDQLIGRELTRARFAGQGAGRHFHPTRDLTDLIEVLRQLYDTRGITIEMGHIDAATLPFDREDMLELLGNLLDNACKWARHRVRLDILHRAILHTDSFEFIIQDDGPGIAASARERLLRRGARLDEQGPGHGLGLAIASELVDSYGGSLILQDAADLGGLLVRVRLPSTGIVADL